MNTHDKVRAALELAARIDTGQDCPAENHAIACAAMEALEAVREPAAGETPETDVLLQCPKCNGPHFNVTKGGTLICASVSKFTNFEVVHGGCGWRSEPLTKAVCSALYNCSTLRHGLFTPPEFSRLTRHIVSEAVRAALPPRSDADGVSHDGRDNSPEEGQDAS